MDIILMLLSKLQIPLSCDIDFKILDGSYLVATWFQLDYSVYSLIFGFKILIGYYFAATCFDELSVISEFIILQNPKWILF